MKPANRIATLQPYYFAKLRPIIARLRKRGHPYGGDIIRMDVGSPDLAPKDFIVDVLNQTSRRTDTHGYTSYGGTPAYRKAVAHYYGNRFGVELDFEAQIVGLIGSKEGLFSLSQAMLDPWDVALVPDPGYATYATSAEVAGAEVYPMPLLAENGFLPDLNTISEDILRRAKILWLNYPNNPTGAVATLEFFQKAVSFARTYNLLIAHDAPYMDVCFDDYQAQSILQVPGAFEVAIEFNSLSKSYNMAGWRLGMMCGNPDVVQYVRTYKSQVDTSHFEPVLAAGIAALTEDQSWLNDRNAIYQERRDVIIDGLEKIGIQAHTPKAALYVWARVPEGGDDYEFCDRMLHEIGVSTTPGSVYGMNGKGYFRMSICTHVERLEEGIQRMMDWMNI